MLTQNCWIGKNGKMFKYKKCLCIYYLLYRVIYQRGINRWVSVVEFNDPTLDIGKVFGQESTVVKWNYQILGLHQVTVRQKLGVILVIKWFWNWSQQKMLFTKKVRLNWYSSMIFFFIKFGLWKSDLGTFWRPVWTSVKVKSKKCFYFTDFFTKIVVI